MLEGSCLCGKVRWRFDAEPDGATACNCTACRRYGALWIYGHEGLDVRVTGSAAAYMRQERSVLAFHFCPDCGCVTHWRGQRLEPDGRRRMAVNLRLVSDPDAVAAIPIDHFDGLVSFDDLPRDGRCVSQMWF
ncbi:MAG: GFA family protein [Geminicoccaceae bacterium]